MKKILTAIILRFIGQNLDSIISALTKIDKQLDAYIARQGDVYVEQRTISMNAMDAANAAADQKNRAERIRSRVKALTA